jgi:hypothetical protein
MNIFRKNDDIRTLVQAFAGALAVAVLAMFGGQAYATAVTLSVTVATSLTFTITTNQFGTQTDGNDNLKRHYQRLQWLARDTLWRQQNDE